MTAPPSPSPPVTARRFYRPAVRVASPGEPLSKPLTEGDESDEFACTQIRITAGGEVDAATLSRRLGWSSDDLEDSDTLPRVAGDREQALEGVGSRRVEIWLEDPERPRGTPKPLFVGVLRERRLGLDGGENGETEDLVASLEPDDFGGPVRGCRVVNPIARTIDLVEVDPEFNPTRERTELLDVNMSEKRPPGDTDAEDFARLKEAEHPRLWLFPDSVRTDVGKTLHEAAGEPQAWTLREAIRTMQSELLVFFRYDEQSPGDDSVDPVISPGPLPAKPLIEPALSDAETNVLTSADDEQFANVVVRRGERLPNVLDQLLTPLGFGWRVDHSLIPTFALGRHTCRSAIRFFAVRKPTKSHRLRLPKRGETVVDGSGVVTQFSAATSKAGATSRVHVTGELEQYEVTVELYRDWPAQKLDDDGNPLDPPESYDEASLTDVTIGDQGSVTAGYERVWRNWVGNEAGDRTGTRPEIKRPELEAVIGPNVPRRRPLVRPLTLRDGDEETRLDHLLEWKSNRNADWEEAPEGWGLEISEDEIGVVFTGTTPPSELVLAHSVRWVDGNGDEVDEPADPINPPNGVTIEVYPRLRITGTIHGDRRVSASTGNPTDDDGNEAEATEYQSLVSVEDRVAKRSRPELELANVNPPPDPDVENDKPERTHSRLTQNRVAERDDTDKAGVIAGDMQKRQRLGQNRHAVTLTGIVANVRVGDHIECLRTRGVSLAIDDNETPPYVDAITYDFAEQTTRLELQQA